MGQMNKVIRKAQIELREQKITTAELHEIEAQCFDDCDRIMMEAIKSMEQDAGLASDVEVKVSETQPQTDHQERQEERHDDPEEPDGSGGKERLEQRRCLRPRNAAVNYKY